MKNRIYFLITLCWSSIAMFAQSPNISYPAGTYTFGTGAAITPLSPTNIGGTVPATIYGQVSTLFGSAVSFNYPNGITLDSGGNLYVVDNHKIQKITLSGVATTLAGSNFSGSDDGVGTAARFYYPTDVSIDPVGNVFVADSWNSKIRKITPLGVVTTFAGSGILGSADGIGVNASFTNPIGLFVNSINEVYVADHDKNKIRKITSTGVVTTLAGSGTAGSANGVGTVASFNWPTDVVENAQGIIYVCDYGNNKIRKITSSGSVTTFAGSGTVGSADGIGQAASFNEPSGIAIDFSGNIYVADSGNNKIRKITSAGVVTTFAGSGSQGSVDGIGTIASFYEPSNMSIDSAGNLYVTDRRNNKIRKINTGGYTISPSLIPGLLFDSATGTITGTPTVASAAINYTITAYNTSGSNSTTIVIATTTLGASTFNKQELKLYPNPVTTLLQIQIPNNTTLDKVSIIDLTGKKVLEKTQNINQIDVAHLSKGIYIIEAFSGEEKFSSKFMKE